MRYGRRLVIVILLFGFNVVIGCAHLSSPIPPQEMAAADWLTGSPPVQFRLQGRLWVKTEEQELTGLFTWDHRPEWETLELSSPLGQTLARLTRNNRERQEILLETATENYRFATWEELEAALTKAQLPVLPLSALRYWAFGLPAAWLAPVLNPVQTAQTRSFQQADWHILLDQYTPTATAVSFPNRIRLRQESTQLKLFIDERVF